MSFEMNLETYSRFVKSEARLMIPRTLEESEQEVLALSNALGGECGELQNVVKKIISKNVFLAPSELHDQFVLEAGDTLWYLFRLIQKAGYTVEEIMKENVHKLEEKYNTGVDTWRK